MHKLLLTSVAVTTLALGGCGHLKGVAEKPDKIAGARVCNKVEEPPRTPLNNFSFHPLPLGTISTDGVAVVAGLTADDIADIVGNHQALQTRDEKWRGRAGAINICLDDAAKDAVAAKK